MLNLVDRIKKQYLIQKLKQNDIYALVELNKIDVGFFPKTSYSIAPSFLLHIINDLIINNRQFIFEVGTGVSTIYLKKIISALKLNTKIFTIDENEKWQNTISNYLASIDTIENVEFVNAPILNIKNNWYDIDIIKSIIKECRFDLIIIDGPSTQNNKKIRENILPYLNTIIKITNDCSLFIDDTYRYHERKLAIKVAKDNNLSFIDYLTYIHICRGQNFTTQPGFQGFNYRIDEYFKTKNKG